MFSIRKIRNSNRNQKRKAISLFLTGVFLNCSLVVPLNAAEKIFLSYEPLILSLQVESLAEFARSGKINQDLGFYLEQVSPEQQKAFREALNKSFKINPILISRFLNTKIGEEILTRLGKAITIQGGANGKYALRAALVQSALESGDISLLKVIQKLPVNMQLQGKIVEDLAEAIDVVVAATETLTVQLRNLTKLEAKKEPNINYQELPDLRQKGSYQVKKVVWNLVDKSRDREFYVDVFVPQNVQTEKIPVVIFSHGLSSRPEDYAEILEHIASYGYLVAAPQHPGSDIIYLQEMFEGYHANIFDVQEFINRPKDISYVIDELERRNATEFGNKLDLENIGISGHSFGGYTALAMAGAEIDFANLQHDCDQPYGGLDISLLLECRALELPRQQYSFRDKRIKAVFAANPVNRSIYGKKGLAKIEIPILLASGSYDPATPPALEQAASFTWLTVPDKYWIMIEGQAHVNFTKLDAGVQKAIDTTVHLALPSQNLISDYVKGSSVAFFEVYIRNNNENIDRFRQYLRSSYAEYLSRNEEFKLDLISNTSSPHLEKAIEEFRAKHNLLFDN